MNYCKNLVLQSKYSQEFQSHYLPKFYDFIFFVFDNEFSFDCSCINRQISFFFYYRQLLLFKVTMDEDTIFPILSNGERIVGKYQNIACRQCVETTAIVTNFRLLIRWKHIIFCCFTRSYYSSIILDSINRIDETRHHRIWHFFFLLLELPSAIVATILGFVYEIVWLQVIGIIGIVVNILLFIVFCFWFKKKFVTVKGSFGSETMRFDRATAREFEGRLSEMIHQRRIQPSIQQGNWHGPPSGSPLVMAPTYFVESDRLSRKAANNYLYEPPIDYY